MDDIQKRMNKVFIPNGLSDRQVELAKSFVYERHQKGVTITDFLQEYNVSSSTWYGWKKNIAFDNYIIGLQDSLITDDVKEAYEIVKRKILKMATSDGASLKEIELFINHFEPVVEHEKRKALKKIGIDSGESIDTRTIEEKRNELLSRLKK